VNGFSKGREKLKLLFGNGTDSQSEPELAVGI